MYKCVFSAFNQSAVIANSKLDYWDTEFRSDIGYLFTISLQLTCCKMQSIQSTIYPEYSIYMCIEYDQLWLVSVKVKYLKLRPDKIHVLPCFPAGSFEIHIGDQLRFRIIWGPVWGSSISSLAIVCCRGIIWTCLLIGKMGYLSRRSDSSDLANWISSFELIFVVLKTFASNEGPGKRGPKPALHEVKRRLSGFELRSPDQSRDRFVTNN